MKSNIVESGPGHKFRYHSDDLSLFNASGAPSSMMATRPKPDSAYENAADTPAIPAPTTTASKRSATFDFLFWLGALVRGARIP